jgi:acyl-CoA thioester hydrolase
MSLRDDDWRRRADCYPLHFQLQSRYGDMDSNAHLNNVAIARLFEESRLRLHQEILRRGGEISPNGAMIVHIAIDYLGEGHYPEDVQACIGVIHLGRSSYRLAHGLFQQGRAFALAESVMVSVEKARMQPAAIAPSLKQQLQTMVMPELAG